jgi:hypothetical protein
MTRNTDAEVKAAMNKLGLELRDTIITRPVARPALRAPVAARPFKHRSHGNGELMQLIVSIPFGILAVYITIKIINFFL